MEISEEQRKQAIVNARRAKLGKSKCEPATPSLSTLQIFKQGHVLFCRLQVWRNFFSIPPIATFQAPLTPTVFRSTSRASTRCTRDTSPSPPACLSSRSLHWPSRPRGSPTTCSTPSHEMPFSGNEDCDPPTPLTFHFFCMSVQSEHCPEDLETLYICMFVCVCFPVCKCTVSLFLSFVCRCHVHIQCLQKLFFF